MLANDCDSGTICIWNYTTGDFFRRFLGHSQAVFDMGILPNGNLISCSQDSTICVWNILTGICFIRLRIPGIPIKCVKGVSDDGLVSFSFDKTIRLWNLTTNQHIKINDGVDFVECLLLLEDGQLAGGEKSSLIKIWNLDAGLLSTYLVGHKGAITSLVRLKKGHMASSSEDNTIKIWNYENPEAAYLVTFLLL